MGYGIYKLPGGEHGRLPFWLSYVLFLWACSVFHLNHIFFIYFVLISGFYLNFHIPYGLEAEVPLRFSSGILQNKKSVK